MTISIPQKKGLFVWYPAITENGDVAQIVRVAQDLGLSNVQLKCADGVDTNPRVNFHWAPEVLNPIVEALAKVGIDTYLWQYVYGLRRNARVWNTDLQPEAAVMLHRLEQIPAAKGAIVDAEGECKASPDGLREYMHDLRSKTTKSVGLCSYRFPSYHTQLPWDVSQYCDYYLPQMYWEGSHNPVKQLNQCLNEYGSGRYGLRRLPVIPAGAVYSAAPGGQPWSPTLEDLHLFNDAVQNGFHLPGISWWYWTTLRRNPDWTAEIKSHQWAVRPFPLEPTPAVPLTPGYPQAWHVAAPSGANLRKSADIMPSNIIRAYPKGTAVQVLANDRGWVYAQMPDGKKGYICLVDTKNVKLILPD